MSSTTCSSEQLIVVPRTTADPLLRSQTEEEEVFFAPSSTVSIVAPTRVPIITFRCWHDDSQHAVYIAGDRPIVMERE